MMNDLISRQAAIDALVGITMFKTKHELMQRVNASVQDEQGWLGAVAECLDEIEDLPSAQPEPKKGKWRLADSQNPEDKANGNFLYFCSNCFHADLHAKTQEVPYCWYCGAEMEGE